MEAMYKKVQLLCKAKDEYYYELTHLLPSNIAFTHIDLPLFYGPKALC